MKTIKTRIMAAALFVLLGVTAQAQVDNNALKQKISNQWAQTLPAIPEIKEVRPTPIAGLYEVVAGGDVIYTDINGQYVLMGELIDLKNKQNLTQERLNSLIEAVDFRNLPFENAIKVVRGNGERKLVIFEDPNCGFCHKFQQGLTQVDNITLYVFLYPILSPDSQKVAQDIWCSPNRAQTWESWMVKEQKPKELACSETKALAENIALGQRYGIKGTPTIIFEDGSRIGGAVGADVVEQKLKEVSTRKK